MTDGGVGMFLRMKCKRLLAQSLTSEDMTKSFLLLMF
jgi:hypothetical protein